MSYCAKKITNEDWLYNSYLRNLDGLGFCYAHEGKLIVRKGYFKFDEFLEEYNKIPDVPNIFHARDTSGSVVNEEMCHPFNINEHLAFAHNGMLKRIMWNAFQSDTYIFNEEVLKVCFADEYESLFVNPAIKENLEDYIGQDNKIIFLDNTGRYLILNEDMGIWERDTPDGDIWWSNDDYLIDKLKYIKHEGVTYKMPRPDTTDLQNLGQKTTKTNSQNRYKFNSTFPRSIVRSSNPSILTLSQWLEEICEGHWDITGKNPY